jgi:hypothetical protein
MNSHLMTNSVRSAQPRTITVLPPGTIIETTSLITPSTATDHHGKDAGIVEERAGARFADDVKDEPAERSSGVRY